MNLPRNDKQLGKLIDKKAADIKSKIGSAIDSAIDCGELLLQAKNSADDFSDWLETYSHVGMSQANKYIRVAVHKVQSRLLFNESKVSSVEGLQKLLPKANEAPEVSEANPDLLGYTGSTPGSSRDSDDWHTPQIYIDLARKVMGAIDLDPFSSVEANQSIQATRILTMADDALSTTWADPGTRTVWMNPPYSRGASAKAVDKFLEEYDYGSFDQAIVLMNSSTDTSWFDRMAKASTLVCFTRGRIAFENNDGKKASGNTKGQVFFYFGRRLSQFTKVFSQIGNVFSMETSK